MDFDLYKNPSPYPVRSDPDFKALRDAYMAESRRISDRFKTDALTEVGLSDHSKRDLIYEKAWADGHAYGYSEVFNCLGELADFVKALEAK